MLVRFRQEIQEVSWKVKIWYDEVMTLEEKVKEKIGKLPIKTPSEHSSYNSKSFLKLAAVVKDILADENEETRSSTNKADAQ